MFKESSSLFRFGAVLLQFFDPISQNCFFLDRQTCRQIDRQKDGQANGQIDTVDSQILVRQINQQIIHDNSRNGSMDGQIDRQIDRQKDRWIDGWMDGWIHGQIERQIDRQKGRQIARQIDRQIEKERQREKARGRERERELERDRRRAAATLRSISGFALPSIHRNNSPLLQFPIFEASATPLCCTTGIVRIHLISLGSFRFILIHERSYHIRFNRSTKPSRFALKFSVSDIFWLWLERGLNKTWSGWLHPRKVQHSFIQAPGTAARTAAGRTALDSPAGATGHTVIDRCSPNVGTYQTLSDCRTVGKSSRTN